MLGAPSRTITAERAEALRELQRLLAGGTSAAVFYPLELEVNDNSGVSVVTRPSTPRLDPLATHARRE